MTENQFFERFKSTSDKELERIALDSKSFIFDARYAAITLLKSRNYDSPVIASVEEEAQNLERAKKIKTYELKEQNERLIRRIRHIPIKGTGKYELENRNVLQVKRLSENRFQARIEFNFRSNLAPVLICKIKDDSSFSCYPFLYLKSILIYGIGGTALMLVLSLLGQVEKDAIVLLVPLIAIIGIQLLMMPLFYFSVLNILKDKLGKKQITNRANRITSHQTNIRYL
jgi:hypothetical protein